MENTKFKRNKSQLKNKTKFDMCNVIKSLIIPFLLLPYQYSEATFTGHTNESELIIQLNRICLKNRLSMPSATAMQKPSALSIVLKVFYLETDYSFETINQETDLTTARRVEEKIMSRESNGVYPLTEFEYNVNRIGNTLNMEGKDIVFAKNTNLRITFPEVHHAIGDLNNRIRSGVLDILFKDRAKTLGRAFKASFQDEGKENLARNKENTLGILGLAVILKEDMKKLSTSLIAFQHPNYRMANQNLLIDYKDEEWGDHAPIHRFYPEIATLIHSKRRVITFNGNHGSLEEMDGYSCNGERTIVDFEIEILD